MTTFAMIHTLQAAMAASATGDVEGALQLYQQASQDEPGSAIPHFLRAAELAQAQRYGEAEAAYASAVLLGPDLHIARFELGVLQFTSGRAAMALLSWEPLMLLPDEHALKLLVQGYAALVQDQFETALGFFRQGMAANTSNEALNSNIALLIAAMERAGVTQQTQTTGATEAGRLPAHALPAGLPLTTKTPSESEVQQLLAAYQQRGQGTLH